MYSELKDMKVIGMAAAVSNTWDSVREFSTEDEAVINKFIKTTGVEGRYSANPRQCTSDFCFAAAEKILAEKKIPREEIRIGSEAVFSISVAVPESPKSSSAE